LRLERIAGQPARPPESSASGTSQEYDSVNVSRTLVVPLKGNKQEYDYLGTSSVPCAVSIFSQDGKSPCWQLRRNQNQNTKI